MNDSLTRRDRAAINQARATTLASVRDRNGRPDARFHPVRGWAAACPWLAPTLFALSLSGCGGEAPEPAAKSAAPAPAAVAVTAEPSAADPSTTPSPSGAEAAGSAASTGPASDPSASSVPAQITSGSPLAEPTVAKASPAVGAPTQVFVAGVATRARSDSGVRSGVLTDTSTPTPWLDVEPPRGSAGAPVFVVVPGALPADASSQALRRGSAVRPSR